MRLSLITILSLIFILTLIGTGSAGDPSGNPDFKLNEIEDRLQDTEQKVLTIEQNSEQSEIDNNFLLNQNGYAPIGMVTFLFGAFCALWAQNTGRSAIGWFFLGLFFNVLTVIALLVRNSQDIDERKSSKPATN